MNWIEVDIRCYADEGDDHLKELGIESDRPEEWRPSIINCDNIMGIYPDFNKENSVIELVSGPSLTCKQSYQQLKSLIENNKQ